MQVTEWGSPIKASTGSLLSPTTAFCPICRHSVVLLPANLRAEDRVATYTGRCWPCSNEAFVLVPLRIVLELNAMLSLPVRVRRMIMWSSQTPELMVDSDDNE